MDDPHPSAILPLGPTRRWLMPALTGALLLAAFYTLAWTAVSAESATIDEPLHAVGAYYQVFKHDYRFNPEDPPLWKYIAMLPHFGYEMPRPPDPADWWHKQLNDIFYQFLFTTHQLFLTDGVNGAAFVNSSRAAMLFVGVALGVTILLWTLHAARSALAAIVATSLFALDPNFLGHSALVKNDVALSLTMLLAAYLCWLVGRRATLLNVIGLSLICAAAVCVKFSGVLIGPIVLLTLLVRAMLPATWPLPFAIQARRRAGRLAAVCGIGATIVACSSLLVWASYGFRFEPTPEPGARLNTSDAMRRIKANEQYLRNGNNWSPPDVVAALPDPPICTVARFVERHRLLPQAWIFGFLFTYQSTLVRATFLLGEHSTTGWWYYFPLAALFKTPVATLVALGVAFVAAVRSAFRFAGSGAGSDRTGRAWLAVCLSVPLLVYGGSAMHTNLNLGLRHVLPLYPLAYVACGLIFASLFRSRRRTTLIVTSALAIGLAAESLAAFPHYISFFNVFSRPYRLGLLSDSNFDWGQDLTYVADWQQRHPATPLYLGYWGSVDPAFYGIRYTNIPGGFVLNQSFEWPPQTNGPAVIAISATLLQGVNCPPSCRVFYAPLRAMKPREILGDTIYLYDWPLTGETAR